MHWEMCYHSPLYTLNVQSKGTINNIVLDIELSLLSAFKVLDIMLRVRDVRTNNTQTLFSKK